MLNVYPIQNGYASQYEELNRTVKHLPALLCLLLLCSPRLWSVSCQGHCSLLHFCSLKLGIYTLLPLPSQLPPFSAHPLVTKQDCLGIKKIVALWN